MDRTSSKGPTSDVVKRVLLGRAVPSQGLEHTRLPKFLALPVFSSDALSSVSYATEEILRVLLIASVVGSHFAMPIAIAIAILLVIVVSSFREIVRAYPNGGGSYIVSKDNLGTFAGLLAAAALLVDYALTVAVSVVAGAFALISAIPSLAPFKVELAGGFIVLITLMNLRGVRESGALFAVPSYAFILSILTMLIVGFARCAVGGCPEVTEALTPAHDLATVAGPIGLFVILHAFSSGATALTGIEAIADAVPSFRHPRAKNAAKTLAIMALISVTMFLGMTYLATHIPGITVSEEGSVIGQVAHTVFNGGPLFFIVQAFTAAILILAANAAYQGFPLLASILARDRYMPRQFANRGDRLVFSNGVIVLASVAGVLVLVFEADLNRLIQLYVVGVFTAFTLAQTGMIRHWLKERSKGTEAQKGWRRSIVVNTVGAAATGVVLVIVSLTKFIEGAWIVFVAVPIIMLTFVSIHRHYSAVMAQLRRGTVRPGELGANHVVLLVRELTPATAEALGYLRSFRPVDVRAVYPVPEGDEVPAELQVGWRTFSGGAHDLEPLPCRGDDLLGSMRKYLATIDREPIDFITVIVPEQISRGLVSYLVRNRDLVRLKAGLLREANVVVTDVPVVVEEGVVEGVDARPLIPQRTVTLVFVSNVNDATTRAVNYARSLGAAETRAIYFELDPGSDAAGQLEQEWFDSHMEIPLDIVEAPFRDLTTPMVSEVRRFTVRTDTVVNVVIPEFVINKWRHLILHNMNALFIKRLFLFEERAALTSVPFPLEDPRTARLAKASASEGS